VAQALGSVFGQSQDNFVMIPVESYFKTTGRATGFGWWPKRWTSSTWSRRRTRCACCCVPIATGPAQDDNFVIFASETFVTLWEQLTKTIAAMAVGVVPCSWWWAGS